uniref:Uncharacterized protein n=1 Tax=Arundo donax TaxID=35708 RepID=A0A0A9DIA8_ARUDO
METETTVRCSITCTSLLAWTTTTPPAMAPRLATGCRMAPPSTAMATGGILRTTTTMGACSMASTSCSTSMKLSTSLAWTSPSRGREWRMAASSSG